MLAPRCANPPAVPTLKTRSGLPIEEKAAYVETLAAVVPTLFPPKRSSLKSYKDGYFERNEIVVNMYLLNLYYNYN